MRRTRKAKASLSPSDQSTKTILYVGTMRRDGKYPVTYVFPASGKKIRKILTLEKLQEEGKTCDIRQGSGTHLAAYWAGLG